MGLLKISPALLQPDGRVLGLMPHPERAMDLVNLYTWPLMKERMKREGVRVPPESPNMQFFRNVVEYFR